MPLYTHLWIFNIEIDEHGRYINIENVGKNTADNRYKVLYDLYLKSINSEHYNYNDESIYYESPKEIIYRRKYTEHTWERRGHYKGWKILGGTENKCILPNDLLDDFNDCYKKDNYDYDFDGLDDDFDETIDELFLRLNLNNNHYNNKNNNDNNNDNKEK